MARKARKAIETLDNWTLWPRYASHEEVSCFNCGGDMGPDRRSAPGRRASPSVT